MVRLTSFLLLGSLVPLVGLVGTPHVTDGPTYTADGQLSYPEPYRGWIFLTSGFNMSYNPSAKDAGDGMFDNVFVNPEAYRSYQKTGHWPEGAELVLENRSAEVGKSINKTGKTQSHEVMGLEVHVFDPGHLDKATGADGWAFYSFDNKVSAKMIPRTAECYTCHQQHASVDTTFVQFYPTLQDAADKNHSNSPGYLKELNAEKQGSSRSH
jgi:hypothetical protein